LNLGRNPIREIPKSFSLLQSLERLWFDDCQLSGPIPEEILCLHNLIELRISNNALTSIQPVDASNDIGIKRLSNLNVLCLDGNKIENIPRDLVHLTQLQSLLLRKNQINDLPEGVPGPSHVELKLFHVSSNKLSRLPMSLVECPALETIYANGNEISDIPSLEKILTLKYCNLSNNKIVNLSSAFTDRFGDPDQDGKFQQVRYICESCNVSFGDQML
jgi:Leucine-rich repeat (LRR) protein